MDRAAKCDICQPDSKVQRWRKPPHSGPKHFENDLILGAKHNYIPALSMAVGSNNDIGALNSKTLTLLGTLSSQKSMWNIHFRKNYI